MPAWSSHADCVIGRGVQPAMRGIYGGIENKLRQELSGTTLEDAVLAVQR
jgi:hypothetical protein